MAVGPNEGKEGSKAFWGEPLQKGGEKSAEAKLVCCRTSPCTYPKPHRELWGQRERGQSPRADVTQGNWQPKKGPATLLG